VAFVSWRYLNIRALFAGLEQDLNRMYNQGLQRICAFLLSVAFSLQLMAPLLSAEPESKLPACCRRDGKHACSMMTKAPSASTSGKVSVTSKKTGCPLYPSGQTVPASDRVIVDSIHSARWTPPAIVADVAEQMEARFRILFSRATQKRGPPSRFDS
jgi:hypothetical protein